MEERRTGGIVAAVTLITAAAFVAVMALFIYQSVNLAVRNAEELTEIFSEDLSDALSSWLAIEAAQGSGEDARVRDAAQDPTLAQGMGELAIRHAEGQDVQVCCFSGEGEVFFSTADASGDAFAAYPALESLRGYLEPEPGGVWRTWENLDWPLPRSQVLYEVRYDEELGAYLLTVNHAQQTFDEMRQRASTMVLALFVVMMLLLLMIMAIVRWYRTRLVRAATTDELTKLANRKSFAQSFEAFARSLSKDDRVTLALIDVDRFKQINDGFGHAAGDRALAAVAAEIREMVGEAGLAGRWGGDEFIGVLRLPMEEARPKVQAMIERVAALGFEDEGMSVSVSAGITQIDATVALERAVEQADDALYVTKEGGRGFLTIYIPGVTPHMAGEKPAGGTAGAKRAAVPATPVSGTAGPGQPAGRAEARRRSPRSWGRRFASTLAKSLLEAVHHMIPFVAGGGILIGIAFLIDGMSVDVNTLSSEARANFGSLTPIAAGLKDAGSAAFNFMLPIFAAFFAKALAGEHAFMAGFAGGFLASQGSAGFAGAIAAAAVAALVVELMCDFMEETPQTLQRVAPVLVYPVFSLLIMFLLMSYVIDPVASAFDGWLTSLLVYLDTGNDVVLGMAAGAMMATDMGGPINKAAYHFGVAAIASGRPEVMASVMVGGMVPPCGLALCMLLFGDRFSEDERDQGPATLFMGLSFVTEGAIPYVLTDIARVIPACILGSAVAGAASAALGCTLMAPHGGIFVFPVVGNAPLYIVALAAGSLVEALVLGLLKPVRGDADAAQGKRG